jgi:hypothetical protein
MMNWEGFGRKWSRTNFKVLSWHSPGRIEENRVNFGQYILSPSRDLNLRPTEYKAGVLTIRSRRFGCMF